MNTTIHRPEIHSKVKFAGKDRQIFFQTLRSRVDDYFTENNLSRNGNAAMVVKTIVMLSAYVVPFIFILFVPLSLPVYYLLWLVMGLAIAGIGMSVMHDANHGSYSKNKVVNTLLGHTLNLVGGSVTNWKYQHNILHHTYTNIVELDDDIKDKLVLRFSPHTKVKWYHRFQYIYAFAFYGILTLYWTFIKDFLQFHRYTVNGVNRKNKQQNNLSFLKLILAKAAYILAFVVLPLFIIKVPVWEYLTGFMLMHFIAGLVLTVIFQLAHTVEHTTHPLPNDHGTIENNWAIHQLNTTVNFSRNNKLISWYIGGLNFQVEHHLFPNICHVHYPSIAPIVKQTAEEFGIPYLENPTFGGAIASHIRILKEYGRKPEMAA